MSELRFFSSLNIPTNNFHEKMRRNNISKIKAMPPQGLNTKNFHLTIGKNVVARYNTNQDSAMKMYKKSRKRSNPLHTITVVPKKTAQWTGLGPQGAHLMTSHH